MSSSAPARSTMRGALLQIKSLGLNPRTVIDVGAALGTFDLYEVFPEARHILIEPIAENEPYLAQICRAIGHAEYLIAAAAKIPGTCTLEVNSNLVHSMMHTAEEAVSAHPDLRTIPTISLDQIYQERHLEPPFLIKIDVDGKEPEVLAGATQILQETDYVIVEVALLGQMYEVMDVMRSHGFVAYDCVDLHHRPSDAALWQLDMAFVKESSRFRQDKMYIEAARDRPSQERLDRHLQHYRDANIAYINRYYSEIAPTLYALNIGDINLLLVPDWHQPEEILFSDLFSCLKRMAIHPDLGRITVLIDQQDCDAEKANVMLSEIALTLAQADDLELSDEGPLVTLVEPLTDAQWQGVLPYLTAYISLPHEGKRSTAIATATLPVYSPEEVAERRAQQTDDRWSLV